MGKRGEAWFLLQLVLLALVFVSSRFATAGLPTWIRILGGLLLAAGGVLGTAGGLALGRNLSPFPRPIEGGHLVTGGAYRVVRHPIYAGLILGTLGWALLTDTLIGVALAAAVFVFFDLKSRREERWLADTYPDYRDYQSQVRKLVPWLY